MFEKKKRKYHRRRSTYKRRRPIKKVSKSSYRKRSFLFKFFSSLVAVVSISALILLITVIISEISNPDKSIKNGIMSKFFTRYSSFDNSASKVSNIIESVGGELAPVINKSELLFKICVFSDIHEDEENLKKSMGKISEIGCEKIFVIGDVTNYGDVNSLKKIRNILEGYGIDYYAIPGDHDIAESMSVENFNSVFGINYHILEHKGVWFMMIDNSPNFTEIGDSQMNWIERNIGKADFVVLSQPLYVEGLNPPFNSTYMGSMLAVPESDDMKEKQAKVREQGEFLLDMIRKNTSIKATIAGEHHRSSKIEDSVRLGLVHHVLGAVTSTVNDFPQTAIQTSRFSVLSVYKDGNYMLDDVLID